ncbi:MAG: HEAT repeat domain-containing protein [Planctomycetes bacterium]|nr:HEAT repeat domain-containing protein [Planctomycetota bacterium]
MRVTREEPAPDRETWERQAREAAARLEYREVSPGRFRKGSWLGFHPDAARLTVAATWADGKGTWEARSCGFLPRSRALLRGRLDELQGKPSPGSALQTLAAAAAGSLAAWIFAAATMFILALPLVREAKIDWAARQERFEIRLDTARAPIAERVRAAPEWPAAFIPAVSFGFLVAVPIILWFAAGELLSPLSRLNAVILAVALVASPAAFIAPGVAWPGLLAGLAAPLAAAAGYAAVRGLFRDASPPARPLAWAGALAGLVAVAAAFAPLLRQIDVYTTIRDRVLLGNPAGESIATFYYRHTPLSAYAVRPPALNPRTVALVAGPLPFGFPSSPRHILMIPTLSREEFLREARGPGWTFLIYNEHGAAWAAEAAAELKRTHPGRAAGFVGVSEGGLEKVFPEADPRQFVTAALLRDGTSLERKPRSYAAIDAAWAKADRRRQLRNVAGAATSLSIFLGPPLLAGAFVLWTAALVAALRGRGLKRAAGAVAVLAALLVTAGVLKLARPEPELQRKLRDEREKCDTIRTLAQQDGKRWMELKLEAERVLPDLKSAAKHPEISVRVLAADALGACGHADAMPVLGEMTRDPSILVRYRATDALARFTDTRKRIWYLSEPQNDEIYVAESALAGLIDYRP